MAARDLDFVARLHREALPHGFFAELGLAYLRAYHASFLESPFAITLVAEIDESPSGFVVGTVDNRAHHRFVVRERWWPLTRVGTVSLALHPRLATRFIRTRARRYTSGAMRLVRGPGHGAPASPVGVLDHVAVVESRRGEGAGVALVETFAETARARGLGHLRLSTRADEAGMGPFYEALGWQRAGTSTDLDGREWVTYLLDL